MKKLTTFLMISTIMLRVWWGSMQNPMGSSGIVISGINKYHLLIREDITHELVIINSEAISKSEWVEVVSSKNSVGKEQ